MYIQSIVDKFFPDAPIYSAMGIWTIPKKKIDKLQEICESGEYFAQVKKDGNWYGISISKNGKVHLFGRGISTTNGLPLDNADLVPHITSAFSEIANDTFIIGEIYYPNGNTNDVRSIMGCKKDKAVQRQKEKGFISFYMHDIIRYNGEDYTNIGNLDRYKKLEEIYNNSNLLKENQFVILAKNYYNDIYNLGYQVLRNNEEGLVLKSKNGKYVEDSRPAWNMIKWKKHDTVDVVCMGFEKATKIYNGLDVTTWEYWEDTLTKEKVKGNYYGKENYLPITKPYYNDWYTSMIIGAYNDKQELEQIGTVSSGLDEEIKIKIKEHYNDFIGKVVECDCMELTDNSIRHPAFIRFRDDKKATECILSNIFKK